MANYRVKQLYDIVDGVMYIDNIVHLTKTGNLYRARCPFHLEKTPSFTVYPKGTISHGEEQDHTSFYCFGCGKGGDIIQFKKYIDNLSSRNEAIVALEKEFNIEIDENSENNFYKSEMEKAMEVNNLMSFSEINLWLSSKCRIYLDYMKQKHPEQYHKAERMIDGYYRYIDYMMPECNLIEANQLYHKITNKISSKTR